MSGFLIEFNRRTRELVELKEFSGEGGPRRALRARLDRELQRVDDDIEIVSINAESEEVIRSTHARYFGSPELARA